MSFRNARIVCKDANPVEYHRDKFERGNPGFIMSSSKLREFAACPERWMKGYTRPASDASAFGNLVDCLVLTPKSFLARYWLPPATCLDGEGESKPWDYKSKARRDQRDEQIKAGKEVATGAEVDQARLAAASVVRNPILKDFIDASDRQVWCHAEWHDPDTGFIVPVQVLLDMVPRLGTQFEPSLGDLKTTKNAAPGSWRKWAFSVGYHVQAALYGDIYNLAANERRVTWCFALVENFPPYQTGRRMFTGRIWREAGEQPEDTDFIELGRGQYRRMLKNYAWCLKNGKWPDYDEDKKQSVDGWTLVEPDARMLEQGLGALTYGEMEVQEQEEDEEPESFDQVP